MGTHWASKLALAAGVHLCHFLGPPYKVKILGGLKHSLSQYLELDIWNQGVVRVTLSGSGGGSICSMPFSEYRL